MTEPAPRRAADVMTTQVVSVLPGDRVEQVARVLLRHGISAVPVIGADGALAGMVSEGDLIGRREAGQDGDRRDWWLSLLADGEPLSPDFLATLRSATRVARDVMATPVVTVAEATDVAAIAELLTSRRIKRVPVLRDGRVVGIVSRSDLLGAIAGLPRANTTRDTPSVEPSRAAGLRRQNIDPPSAANDGPQPDHGPSAESFRALEEGFHSTKLRQDAAAKSIAAGEVQERVKLLLATHLEGPVWNTMLTGARRAAAHGEREFLLLTFPSDLCADRGRAINAAEAGWPATLRGEALEIYQNWERDLRTHGFKCSARVLTFPGGFPGDVGLYLTWG